MRTPALRILRQLVLQPKTRYGLDLWLRLQRSLVWFHKSCNVGLPRRNVHLDQGVPTKKKQQCPFEGGSKGHSHQEKAGRKMGGHHRIDKSEAAGEPCRP